MFDHIGESNEEAVRRVKAEAAAQVCPRCKKQEAVPIFYGLYRQEGLEGIRNDYGQDGFALGGCCWSDKRGYAVRVAIGLDRFLEIDSDNSESILGSSCAITQIQRLTHPSSTPKL